MRQRLTHNAHRNEELHVLLGSHSRRPEAPEELRVGEADGFDM
jgi:hypothetical protein